MATDPARLSRWWAEVLGYRILGERVDEVDVGPGEGEPVLSFGRATAAPPGQGRVQLDISVDDRDAELERLLDMGARPVEGGTAGRLVLVDPEGNEFSLVRTDLVGTDLVGTDVAGTDPSRDGLSRNAAGVLDPAVAPTA